MGAWDAIDAPRTVCEVVSRVGGEVQVARHTPVGRPPVVRLRAIGGRAGVRGLGGAFPRW